MYKRILAVVLCASLIVSVLPVLSFADNSGFCQIRIFYKESDSLGNFGSEKSAIITDNSFMAIATRNMLRPIQITRFLIRNDSNATAYFQFDINFGGEIPSSGSYPTASYSSLSFTANGGVTAYSFATTDQSPFFYHEDPNTAYGTALNSAASRTFFGKVESSGYITFNTPVTITFNKNDSPASQVFIFFRHLVIGYDSSSYLVNIEQLLGNIDGNVNDISDWIEEEHEQFQSAWDNGAGTAYDDYSSDNGSFFGTLRDIFGLGLFGLSWNIGIFNSSNNFFSNWFSQANSNNINGAPRRSVEEETEYVDYYSRNQSGDLDIFGVD